MVAADLVEVHRKYKARGVTFVSLTPNSREIAQQFIEHFEATWPCMFDTPNETLVALGALSSHSGSFMVFPTLDVIGRDGKVRWSDQRARWYHGNRAILFRNLQRAIDEALK